MARGFTLIEMVITLTIIGLIAAIAMPRFTGMSDAYKLDAAQAQLTDTIQNWTVRAKASSRGRTIYFDIANEVVYLYDGPVTTPEDAEASLDLGAEPFGVDIRRTNLSANANKLAINGYGLLATDASIRLARNDRLQDITIEGGGKTNSGKDPVLPAAAGGGS